MDPQDAQKGRQPARPLTSNSMKTQYLIIYNFVSALLWLVVLGRVITIVPLLGTNKAYPAAGEFTKWTQTLALMEVVHAAVGIVRAPVSTTAMQVASRILLVWGVVNNFPFVAKSAGYSSMLIAWSVTEVIRYSFFTLSLSNMLPGFMMWLRYNTFFILYPLGISSECWLIYKAVEPAKRRRQEYAWALQLILFIYIPGSYILFTHMMAQRKKVLRGMRAEGAQKNK